MSNATVVLDESAVRSQLLQGKDVERELLRICKQANPHFSKFDVHKTKTRLVIRPRIDEATAQKLGYYLVSVPTKFKYKLYPMSKFKSQREAQRIADYYFRL
jgi:hypothetical protein